MSVSLTESIPMAQSQKKILVIDTETSGLRSTNSSYPLYLAGPQTIELGAVVSDARTFSILDRFTTKVRFLGSYEGIQYGEYPELTWDPYAATIHGQSPMELSRHPHPRQASEIFVQFLKKHFDVNERITLAGHNPEFDAYHVRQLLYLGGMIDAVKFNHRMLDTNTLGMFLYQIDNSEELFSKIAKLKRDKHEALEDAIAANQVLAETSKRISESNFVSLTSY